MDYESEYNNRGRVPEHPEIIAGWERDAAAYRESADAELGLSYGPSERMKADIFHPAGAAGRAPLALFIHGGYWQGLDRSFFSHMASGLNARGVAVAVPSYDLCPEVTVRQIVEEMQRLAGFLHARTGGRMVASGHSAGGHLTAALVATDWLSIDPTLPPDLVPAGLAISGVFDLVPLVETGLNAALKLDKGAAWEVSPLFWPVPVGRRLEAWVGGAESNEFLRQSREIARIWGDQGTATAFKTVAEANHFTVIAPLTDPESEMVAALAEMARAVAE